MIENERWILYVERDSVCAGDDVYPHDKRLAFKIDITIGEVIAAIVDSEYLAGIAGGKATWVAEFGKYGKSLAVVAQQWTSPKFLIDSKTRLTDFMSRDTRIPLFFRYMCQVDPMEIFDNLNLRQTFANEMQANF